MRKRTRRLTYHARRWAATGAVALLSAIGASFASPASALVWADVPSHEEITRQSSLGFRGVVVGISYGDATTEPGQSLPYAVTTFEVLRGYRGATAGERIEIAQMGGLRSDMPNRFVEIPGAATFGIGDEVIVFANDERQPFFGALFGDHGVFRVVESDRGERLVTSSSGNVVIDAGGRIGIDAERQCRSDSENPRRCVDRDARGHLNHGDEPARPRARAMRATDFDAHVEEILRGHHAPTFRQKITGERSKFEDSLRNASRRMQSTRPAHSNR